MVSLLGFWSEEASLLPFLRDRLPEADFLPGRHPSTFVDVPLDLLVLAPDARALAGFSAIRAPLALLPGGRGAPCRGVRAFSAVSYGPGEKNTLTFSSLTPRRFSLTLQRRVVTLSGRPLEPQEWPLPALPSLSPEELLCLYGTLLLLDRLPDSST